MVTENKSLVALAQSICPCSPNERRFLCPKSEKSDQSTIIERDLAKTNTKYSEAPNPSDQTRASRRSLRFGGNRFRMF